MGICAWREQARATLYAFNFPATRVRVAGYYSSFAAYQKKHLLNLPGEFTCVAG